MRKNIDVVDIVTIIVIDNDNDDDDSIANIDSIVVDEHDNKWW